MENKIIFETDLGFFSIEEKNDKIIRIERAEKGIERDGSGLLKFAKEEILKYLSGNLKKFSFPIYFEATEFETAVYMELMKVRYGSLISYGELAEKAGRPNASRAVGNAVGKNPLLFVIPCHRVIRFDGKLGGFSAGIELKKYLIEMEKEEQGE